MTASESMQAMTPDPPTLGGKVRRSAVAVVIPVFKHPALLLEAIESVRAACERGDAHVVIVDDGCPYFQTMFSASLAAGGNVHYVRQINRGLSGARNCGVEFVLEYLPDCEAVYFLDSDNRLSSFSIDRFQTVLAESPEIDWFYPDIVMFGIPWSGDYSGPFRCLTESLLNICEAGSLVRRRVFEEGCRFDENMRSGYEDWEFWISLMERGFVGQHMPASGFLYRKRAESMLADSGRRHGEIMEYIETKHSWMRDVRTLVALEHHEAPRFAVVCSDTETVLLGSDPLWMREVAARDYSDLLRLSLERPNWASAGAVIAFSSRAALKQLQDCGLLRSVFWRAEVELASRNFVNVALSNAGDGFYGQSRASKLTHSDLLFIKTSLTREILADTQDTWIAQILRAPEAIGCVGLDVYCPEGNRPAARLRNQRQELYEFMRRERLRSPPELWSGRMGGKHEGTPDVATLPARLQSKFRNGALPCRIGDDVRSVAMVLPIAEFGGVEKVAFRVAGEFKRRGFRVDLIIYGNKRAHRHQAFADAYDEIYIIDHVPHDYGGPAFEGTHLPTNMGKEHPEIENLLRSYDAVVNCHAAGVLHYFADLRRAGVVTVDYIHLIEYTPQGRATGHPMVGLAFEHSIDLMACCSRQLAIQIGALGVPHEKIVELPNGPGAVIAAADVAATAGRRTASSPDKPLSVLYLGRLDAQKGLDRLREIAMALRAAPDLLEMRIVGGRVVDSDGGDEIDLGNEPPVYGDEEIAALYKWADVIVMPSRYEGLPLTIIEAMMLGVVPIVTDVGAVREVVADGENGYVVSGERVAEKTIELVMALARDRALLRRLSANASATAAARDWTAIAAPLIERVEMLVRQRASAKRSPTDFRILKQPRAPLLTEILQR